MRRARRAGIVGALALRVQQASTVATTATDYEDLPFAPGSSPFHLKGIGYRGHVEYENAFIPGGASAVNAACRAT